MRALFLFFFCCFTLACLAQKDAATNGLSLRASVAKTDYFTGFEFTHACAKNCFIGQFDVGYSRTILQGRFFPRIGLGYGYLLINRPFFRFSPIMTTAYSSLSTVLKGGHPDRWSETYIGYRLTLGKSWSFVHAVSCGLFQEMTYDTFIGRYKGVSSFGFYGSIGVQYAW
jgi:hypothetical protein